MQVTTFFHPYIHTRCLAGCPLQGQENTEVREGGGEEGEFKLPQMPCPSELPGFSIRWKFTLCVLGLAPCLTSKEHQRRGQKDKDVGDIDR